MTAAVVTLAPRARVLVSASPRQSYAVARLRRGLEGRQVDLVGLDGLAALASDAELSIVLSDPDHPAPPEFADSADTDSLPEDGFELRTGTLHGCPALQVAGGGVAGVIHGVDELLLRQVTTGEAGIALPPLRVRQTPALPFRLLWTWDHSTNWYLEQIGFQDIGALNPYSKPQDGFLQDYCRLVDFMSLHRIGGVTIYGFLRDAHGGIEAAQELCRYARERGVRIIPGVGINAYGGIYWEGDHRYNLSAWLQEHPELRATTAKPPTFDITDFPQLVYPRIQYSDSSCPSRVENQRYHQEAIRWLAETFEIGGINFETGDYGLCTCAECTARRGASGDWSVRDMLMLYPDLFEAARSAGRDLWLICEAYYDSMLNLDAVGPLGELPADVLYQFTASRTYWQRLATELTAEHVARLPHRQNLLSTHMASQWNFERYAYVAPRLAQMVSLLVSTGMRGATIWGEVSAFSTVNEINYLAFARFGYDATLTWKRFLAEDLAPLLGGPEATERFLALLTVPAESAALSRAIGEAREYSAPQSGETYRRWIWLQHRLLQQQAMLPSGA